jgi:hypothetical protein
VTHDLAAVRARTQFGEDDRMTLHEFARRRVTHERHDSPTQGPISHVAVTSIVISRSNCAAARSSSANASDVTRLLPRANWKRRISLSGSSRRAPAPFEAADLHLKASGLGRDRRDRDRCAAGVEQPTVVADHQMTKLAATNSASGRASESKA